MNTLVEVKDLSVSYFTYAGEVQSVRDISFEIKPGKTTALVGESGCGKSVTSKSLMGLIERPGKIKEGSKIFYEGKNLLEFTEKEWLDFRGKECSMIFQDALVSLNPTLMIGKQIMENLENHNGEGLSQAQIRDKARQMLELVGIPDAELCLKKYPHELSGGMRQRVMIAIALACEPKLLIADEPTTALDVTIQAQILDLMQDLRKKLGMSIIMITHDLGVVASMCEKIAVMYAGHIVEYGTADEIFYEPKHEYTKGLIKSIPKLNVESKERLVPIEGQPVDLLNPPAGCPFAPRCSKCMKICLKQMPPKTVLSDTHYSHCWLLQKEEFEEGEKDCE